MEERTNRLTPWFGLGIAGVVLCVLLATLAWAERYVGKLDESFVLLVYVKHLARDGVVAWNLNDPHVDRLPSFLDLLVKAMVVKATDADPIRVLFWVTAVLQGLAGAIVFATVAWLARARGLWIALGLALAGGILVATSPAIAEGASDMQSGPVIVVAVLALLATWLLAERFSSGIVWTITILAVLVALARPEGIVLGALVLVLTLFDRERPVANDMRIIGGVFVLAVGAFYLWHYRYFGTWLPVVATTEQYGEAPGTGWRALRTFVGSFPGVVALLPALLAPFALFSPDWKGRTERFRYAVVALVGLALLITGFALETDARNGARLLGAAAAVGSLAVLAGAIWGTGYLRQGFVLGAVVVGALQLVLVAKDLKKGREAMAHWPDKADSYLCDTAFANALAQTAPDATLATSNFLRLKYFADKLHLSDLQLIPLPEGTQTAAQLSAARDAAVLQEDPDVWLWGSKNPRNRPMSGATVKEMTSDIHKHKYFTGADAFPDPKIAEQMGDGYVPVSAPLCGRYYNALVHKAIAGQFAAAGFIVGTGSDNTGSETPTPAE